MVKKLGIGCVGLFVLLIIIVLASSNNSVSPTGSLPAGGSTTPTRAASAPAAPTAAPSPVVVRGTGQTATEVITLPAAMSMGTFTHQGTRNFIVQVFPGGDQKDLLINTIGNYAGIRPLFYSGPVRMQIEADGPWTVTITAIEGGGTVTANAKGDWVGKYFAPPGSGSYRFTHDGTRNFVVYLHCGGQRQLIQNTIGVFNGTKIIQFGQAPCVWEVQADGTWAIAAA